ncbi:Protein crumbs [Papilio machaon]|uniref:Protein crumbs n=1 Tax=Papilio machaon TaxID=76193 RepID=A0A0N1PHS9_PAPMA|nr:Protein crumbs [Papilio machaon]
MNNVARTVPRPQDFPKLKVRFPVQGRGYTWREHVSWATIVTGRQTDQPALSHRPPPLPVPALGRYVWLWVCLGAWAAASAGVQAAAPAGPSARPEAYFNGSSYIRLARPISLKQLVGLSFRTCVGGELFSQRFEGYTLHVTALFEQVVVSWARPGQPQREVGLPQETLDNRWHWVALRYRPEPLSLLLEVDKDTQVISNVTWNPELLSPGALEAGGAVLLVGNLFSGCMHEGPQLEFHAQHAQDHNVLFGNCPLTTDQCIDRKDVLRIPPKDHCYNEPCMRHGTCISRHDRYECHCSARYTGNNCEVDAGDPCASAPCRHAARCLEDARGDYMCLCTPGYHGKYCELEVSLDPQCVAGPCRNNGSCSVPPGADVYVCACPPGYTGRNCETDVDECAAAGVAGVACLNGGRCLDAVDDYTCDCSGTGYGGPRCEVNVNECEEERGVCGHGVCYDTYGSYVCACLPGYTGDQCQKMSACASGPCGAGGACVEESGGAGYRCVCARGWAPPLLSLPYNEMRYREDNACELRVRRRVLRAGDGGGQGALGAVGGALRLGALRPRHRLQRPAGRVPVRVRGGVGRGALSGGGGGGGGGVHSALPQRGQLRAPLGLRVPARECVEQGGAWRCAAPGAESACASSPCHNGTCLALDTGLFSCQCPAGYTGRFCESDKDECSLMPKICNNGVCVNVPGSYQCYCKPGYTGDSCEQDIDECLSSPCKNGGTCQNLENNYECTCMDGFDGKDCSININECENNPCAAGSTCVDGVASYSCVCQDGLTGPNCEIDIDDCKSQPCQHGGRCADALNHYTCECAGTGYEGADCELNIDECAQQPCRNGGTCLDDLNDYHCACHAGYTGKNCEVDINECEGEPCKYEGICLERSNASLYRAPDAPPLLLGPQPHMLLPDHFYQPFSFDNASGFECVCVAGTEGARCEVNVDECASSPCRHGKCLDGVGGYSCLCSPGFEGVHCDQEIDECLRYKPCAHGRCYDLRASYYCACDAGWGGRNCSVVLEGCRDQPCRNHGTCLPWLRRETEHRFNCSCTPGHYGTTCEKITTMSLENSSYAEVHTSREEGYDISFRFKTTLGNGLLAMGRGLTYFFLELSSGRLNLHSSLLNKWEGVFIGSGLNDSNWQKVFVTINSSHLVLAANEEQTIYPISQNEAFNASVTSFPSTRLGTAGSSYATLTHGPNYFVGCFQDVVVNGQWVLPEDSNATSSEATTEEAQVAGGEEEEEEEGARAELHGVLASCPRVAQCEPNPCQSGGACEDAWSSFVCTCPRPHLGATCQYAFTPATFAHEAAPRRETVRVRVSPAARRAVRAALDISMFIRTRKPTGQIFYLGSVPRDGQPEETRVGASLNGGELLLHLRFNLTPENYTVGGTRLDNGYLHLIEVVRNSTLVQVKLNGTEYFRKSISAARQLDAQPPTLAQQGDDPDYFKGVIQDVQVSNGESVWVVEFFPLKAEGLQLPPSFGEVSFSGSGVMRGVVSDDACASRPCLHNASCSLTWNDYTCACPRGYKGKQCAEVEFCQLQGCPLNSHCRNLDGGYECVSNATFDGANTTLSYRLRVPPAFPERAAEHPAPPRSLTITYRSKTGGTLFHAELGESWFSVGAFKEQVAVQWRLGGGLPALRRMRARRNHLQWGTLRLRLADGHITGAFLETEGEEEVGFSAPIDVAAWQRLMLEGELQLGGVRRTRAAPSAALASPTTPTSTTALAESGTEAVWEYAEGDDLIVDNLVGEYFKGCLGAVHVGELLLPFFSEEELFVGAAASLLARQPYYALL